jgi:hypothetical protein
MKPAQVQARAETRSPNFFGRTSAVLLSLATLRRAPLSMVRRAHGTDVNVIEREVFATVHGDDVIHLARPRRASLDVADRLLLEDAIAQCLPLIAAIDVGVRGPVLAPVGFRVSSAPGLALVGRGRRLSTLGPSGCTPGRVSPPPPLASAPEQPPAVFQGVRLGV